MGAWQVVQWGDPNLVYQVKQSQKEIVIGGAGTYRFYAQDDGTQELDDILALYIPPDLRGAVTVYVAKPNGQPGARDVGLLYLLPAEPGTLAELRVTRDLGVGSLVAVDAVSGPVVVGRDFATSVRVED